MSCLAAERPSRRYSFRLPFRRPVYPPAGAIFAVPIAQRLLPRLACWHAMCGSVGRHAVGVRGTWLGSNAGGNGNMTLAHTLFPMICHALWKNKTECACCGSNCSCKSTMHLQRCSRTWIGLMQDEMEARTFLSFLLQRGMRCMIRSEQSTL